MDGLNLDIELRQPGGFSLQAGLEVSPGTIMGLNGPSGAGKTTLLRCIAGLEHPQHGHVQLGSEPWHRDGRAQLPPHRRSIGYVSQHPDLFPHLNVAANLRLGREIQPDRAEQLFDELGIATLLHRAVSGLSGGQAQRVRIARALLRRPRVLLMDEPFNMLDLPARVGVMRYIEAKVQEDAMCALITSHAPQDLAQLATTVSRISAGRIISQGPAATILNDPQWALDARLAAGSLLHCTVAGQDAAFGVTALHVDGLPESSRIWIAQTDHEQGSPVRLYVHARDVSLARTAATDSSIQNILPATITAIQVDNDPTALVTLQLGTQLLHACVTRKSLAKLQLQVGENLYAQVKSVSLLA